VKRLGKLIYYWALAFKIACDETWRWPRLRDVLDARRLHRELFGAVEEGQGG
jgi:hypothetical protein